ncbi:ankyrin repeat family protein [Carex littledalei]|uniref:Ankyrin repeat family protein n=1 Tax=Carex littledalei TaxID=544730 RepID=A0A833RCC7_9POAL|nr:ankyrin repeat family protein [Carex littledalei]
MKARNKKSETPLHSAAKVGNVDFIRALSQCAPDVVKDAVREIDENKDTALHLAAKHGHGDVARELMKLDPGVANMFNKEGFTPLYIATVGGYTPLAITMLQEAPSLACE